MYWCMSYSSVLWLFYRVLHSALLVNAEGCKEMVFNVPLEGKALTNHVFETIPTLNYGECESLCFLDDRCISYNFEYLRVLGESHKCELSDSDHLMHSKDLVDRPGVTYRSAKNTCNCSKASTCRFNYVHETNRCECKPGFTGETCETNINECAANPCQNGGSCQDQVNSYNCICAANFSGENCEWLRVQREVCIGAKGDKPGSFTIPVDCHILNFKLVYVSGGGISWAPNTTKAYWGTTYRHNSSDLNLQITETWHKTRVSPNLISYLDKNPGFQTWHLPGVTNMDPELIFPKFSPPLKVNADKEFKIWVDQDVNDSGEKDNEGKTCADVWIKKYRDKSLK